MSNDSPQLRTVSDIALERTEVSDWAVSVQSRKPCPWDARLELIGFTFNHRGGTPETVTDVPFEAGTTNNDLLKWLANREDDDKAIERPRET